MRRLDVIRATASVATCEVRLSLWHAPSSADVPPPRVGETRPTARVTHVPGQKMPPTRSPTLKVP